MQSIELIINPNAGHGDGARSGPDIARALTAAGMDCVARLTNGPGHASELAANAAQSGVDCIAIAAASMKSSMG